MTLDMNRYSEKKRPAVGLICAFSRGMQLTPSIFVPEISKGERSCCIPQNTLCEVKENREHVIKVSRIGSDQTDLVSPEFLIPYRLLMKSLFQSFIQQHQSEEER